MTRELGYMGREDQSKKTMVSRPKVRPLNLLSGIHFREDRVQFRQRRQSFEGQSTSPYMHIRKKYETFLGVVSTHKRSKTKRKKRGCLGVRNLSRSTPIAAMCVNIANTITLSSINISIG